MSYLLSTVTKKENLTSTSNSHDISKKKHHRNILKAKENSYKHRCIQTLKKKLKKYRLRHDGVEDQDILDVSQILIKSLKIKSPNSEKNIKNNNCLLDENYPRNYLFKMGKKKLGIKPNENSDLNSSLTSQSVDDNVSSTLLPGGKEQQQTNAFKLLMDSRNKSIGSNSPGKEKIIDENKAQDIIEKKTLKAKRNLALQKMAEGKGTLKKKEMEEYKDYCIKKKMEKRAERLKSMIASNPKTEKESITEESVTTLKETKQKTLKLINLFYDQVIPNGISPEKKVISQEDSEFLKKLSPSLKKKENMLCYFKKVDKEVPISADVDHENSNINDDVIKVKLSTNLKKRAKKKKKDLAKINNENSKAESLSTDCCIEISSDVTVDNQLQNPNLNKDRRKRKRNDHKEGNILNNSNSKNIKSPAKDSRPKRNVKKPVKYTDEAEILSSDDDLHIFTPKKRRQNLKKTPTKHTTKIEPTIKTMSVNKKDKKRDRPHELKIIQKKNVKLAPIFVVKQQVDPVAMEAKQKFLHSGVPDKLKKMITDQKDKTMGKCIFPATVHVQQNTTNKFNVSTTTTLSYNNLCKDTSETSDNELNFSLENNLFKNILDTLLDEKEIDNNVTLKYDKYTILQNIKKIYPNFPVFRTYRLLKKKKNGVVEDFSYQDLDNSIEVIYEINELKNESPDKLNWADKYKATSSKHIFGNFDSIKEIKKWLVTWTENENEVKSRNKNNIESDSSDFYHSDTDSKDSFRTTNNLLMITGPVGSGKTSSVYAVAAELAIKVIEVNASSKRTGKIMLQDLQEATQSHKVNRGKSDAENSQKSQDHLENNKKYLTKKSIKKSSKGTMTVKTDKNLSQNQPTNSQESVRTQMSLILIDDADIVFEQDDGFCSAIVQLVQSSKRPVILITTSSSCTHLQRFINIAKIVKMRPLQPRMLGTWLDIMCLADSGVCVPGTGATILDFFKGDIRKAINSLQFYISTQFQTEKEKDSNMSQNSDTVPYVEDENSGMSWAEHDNIEHKYSLVNGLYNQSCKFIIGNQLNLSQYSHPLELFNMWWSIPTLLIHPIENEHLRKQNIGNIFCNNEEVVRMEAIANALDSVSLAEYYIPNKSAVLNDISSSPWFTIECDSVSENEHKNDYRSGQELIEEISHKLVSGSILEAQKVLNIKNNTDVEFPGMDAQRERNRVVSRHHNLSSSFNPSTGLDRKALALDYWSYCRTICRLEKSKIDNNLKRNNRFCHYLKSLNVTCKTDYFDALADSLNPTDIPNEGPTLGIE